MFLSISGSGFNNLRLPKINRVSNHSQKQITQGQQKIRQFQSPNEKPGSPERLYRYLAKQVNSNPKPYPQLFTQSSMIIIARTMKLSVEQPTTRKQKERPVIEECTDYKYYLGQGNNHELIKKIMDYRTDWVLTKDSSSIFVNFRWQQWNRGYKYERLIQTNQYKQLVNHFEYHVEISNKQYLFKNLQYYCEQNKINVYDLVPVTFVLDFNDENSDIQFATFVKFFDKYAPSDKKVDQVAKKTIEYKKKVKIVVQSQNEKKIPIYPQKLPKSQQGDQFLWLLKPTFLNRGQGIHVINNLETLTTLISEYQEGHTNQEDEEGKKKNTIKAHTFVVQKYVEQPFLINNRKFDIRVWVLVTMDLNCYFFKEGYIRTSCEEFTTGDIENQFVHLTNNAIQKHSQKYGEFEDGNQLSFDDFQAYLISKGVKHDFQQNITKMKFLVWTTLQAVKRKINMNQRRYCMEIFGYDFIVDSELKTWLIEVNTNPCIEESSGLLKMLVPRMIDDAFKLTLDVVFPPKTKLESQESLFPITKYSNNDNLWELLGTLDSPKQSK